MGSYNYAPTPTDTSIKPDLRTLTGKTVVVTGGSSGLGLCYVQAFLNAGAFVISGDLQPPAEDTSENFVFVKCDVTKWEDQENLFKTAKEKSPNNGIDIAIANAGIYGPDILDGLKDEKPMKPATKMLDVNLLAVMYTTKLAGWYFHHQPEEGHDRCIILISSIMGYIDTQGSSVYSAAKHGVRGIMTCIRRKGLLRINCLAPWFVATPIMPQSFMDSAGQQFRSMGVDFATTEDSVSAVLHIASDTSMNGRTLGVVPRQLSPSGYIDLGVDDFADGTPLKKLQSVASSLVYGAFGNSAT